MDWWDFLGENEPKHDNIWTIFDSTIFVSF